MEENKFMPNDMCEKLAYIYTLKQNYSGNNDPEAILNDFIEAYDKICLKWNVLKDSCDHLGWSEE